MLGYDGSVSTCSNVQHRSVGGRCPCLRLESRQDSGRNKGTRFECRQMETASSHLPGAPLSPSLSEPDDRHCSRYAEVCTDGILCKASRSSKHQSITVQQSPGSFVPTGQLGGLTIGQAPSLVWC